MQDGQKASLEYYARNYQPRRKTPAFRRGDIRREVPVDMGAQMFYAEIS